MISKINEPVSVSLVSDHLKKKVFPSFLKWRGKVYKIQKIGLYHTYRKGRVLEHIFSVAATNLFFRLRLDSETLSWRLEEISDGMPE